MRKGQNPAKFVSTVSKPQRITAAVLTYIPFLSGYYAEALDVLRACLDSMHRDAGLPFDTMVFDNGSCREVREYLLAEREAGRIQYLVLSEHNVGKGGAWNMILGGAPGEILAYCDSDVLILAGLAEAIRRAPGDFPNVGMVTARPIPYTAGVLHGDAAMGREQAEVEKANSFPGRRSWNSICPLARPRKRTAGSTQRRQTGRSAYKAWHASDRRLALAVHRLEAHAATIPAIRDGETDGRGASAGSPGERCRSAAADALGTARHESQQFHRLPTRTIAERRKARARNLPRVCSIPALCEELLLAIYNRIFRWYYA